MYLVVIEGDNGTGKDTVGEILANEKKYLIINNDDEAVRISKMARQTDRKEQTFGFLKYSETLGKIAERHEKSLIIRYWMSTLAAAYADYILSWDEVIIKAKELLNKLPIPHYVFYLICNFNQRIERINARNATSFDDRTPVRSERYAFISQEISKLFEHWYVIDTSNSTPYEVYLEIQRIIGTSGVH